MKILHVSCSPRGPASESHRLSRKIIGHLLESTPGATVVHRPLTDGAMPHVDADYALAQHGASAGIAAEGSMARSEVLIRELEDADVLVIATPMHNLSLPSALKAWIDHVVRARRTFNVSAAGKLGLLRDRPVFIAIASGGIFSGERARQPDFLTPYLKAILGTVGLHDLRFFSVQGTGGKAEDVAAARAATDGALGAYFSPATASAP